MEQNTNSSISKSTSAVFESSSSTDAYVQQKIGEILEQGAFRKKTLEITKEYTGTVEFMECVQKYADGQIDKRLFKNTKVVIGILVGWVVTAAIAFIAAKMTT